MGKINPNWVEESRVTIIGPSGEEVIVGSTKLAARDNTIRVTVTSESGATMTIVLGAEIVKGIANTARFHDVRPSPYVDVEDEGNPVGAADVAASLPPPSDGSS